jgi:hypothetical protein
MEVLSAFLVGEGAGDALAGQRDELVDREQVRGHGSPWFSNHMRTWRKRGEIVESA